VRAAQAARGLARRAQPLVDAGVRSGRPQAAPTAVRVDLEHDAAESRQLTSEGARGALARELATLIGRPGGDRGAPRRKASSWRRIRRALARLEAQPDFRRARNEEALKRVAIEEAKGRKRPASSGSSPTPGCGARTCCTPCRPSSRTRTRDATFADRIIADLGASVADRDQEAAQRGRSQADALARVAALDAASARRAALLEERRPAPST
jgi:hypothetical protein